MVNSSLAAGALDAAAPAISNSEALVALFNISSKSYVMTPHGMQKLSARLLAYSPYQAPYELPLNAHRNCEYTNEVNLILHLNTTVQSILSR